MEDFPDVDWIKYDELKREFLEEVQTCIDRILKLLENGYGVNLNPRILHKIYSMHPKLLDDLNIDLSKRWNTRISMIEGQFQMRWFNTII